MPGRYLRLPDGNKCGSGLANMSPFIHGEHRGDLEGGRLAQICCGMFGRLKYGLILFSFSFLCVKN